MKISQNSPIGWKKLVCKILKSLYRLKKQKSFETRQLPSFFGRLASTISTQTYISLLSNRKKNSLL